MRVVELWRYPVKSLGGERVSTAELGPRGVQGDRLWAIRDVARDETTTGRRIGGLLGCTARYAAGDGAKSGRPDDGAAAAGRGVAAAGRGPASGRGAAVAGRGAAVARRGAAVIPADAGPGVAPPVVITFPDGRELGSDDPEVHSALSAVAGREVRLVPLPPAGDTRLHRARLQTPATLRRDLGIPAGERLPNATVVPLRKLAGLVRWTTPPGTFFDLYPLHVVTREGLAALAAQAPGSDFDVRRFRPNVVVEGAVTASDEATACGEPAAGYATGHEAADGATVGGTTGGGAAAGGVTRSGTTVGGATVGGTTRSGTTVGGTTVGGTTVGGATRSGATAGRAAAGWAGIPEFAWAGGLLEGEDGVAIRVAVPTIRCVVPTREQPGLARDPQVMRTVAAQAGRFLGVYADVERAGTLAEGDELTLRLPPPPSAAAKLARRASRRAVGAAQRLIPGA